MLSKAQKKELLAQQAQQGQKGGISTLKKYGSAHFSRAAKARWKKWAAAKSKKETVDK